MEDDSADDIEREQERARAAIQRAQAIREWSERIVLESQAAREAHQRLRAVLGEVDAV
jgi:hypothetical protein